MEKPMEADTDVAPASWEDALAELLAELSSAQDDLLQLLAEKRDLLLQTDAEGLAAVAPREEALIAQLQQCQSRRAGLLQRAADEGLPCESIEAVAAAIHDQDEAPAEQIQQAKSRARLLQHHSLTNWVLAQRAVLHLSQMLEIIATGGRPEPTYKKSPSSAASGALVDQAI